MEFSLEIREELLQVKPKRVTGIRRSSTICSKELVHNMTCFGEKQWELSDLLRELLMGSEIYVDENIILDVVTNHLISLKCGNQENLSEKQVIEMNLRGYLGILNELLYVRHSFVEKINMITGSYVNFFGKFT